MARARTWLSAVVAAGALLLASPAARADDGVLVTFDTGTGDAPGSLTVTNAATGSTTTTSLAKKTPPEACANILSIAAPKIGLKAELDGRSVRIFGRGAIVKVVGASITKKDLASDKPPG